MSSSSPATDVDALHRRACLQKQVFYLDPQTGYQVFTAYGLEQRGECCGSGCRHCPYMDTTIADERRAAVIEQPTWLTAPPDAERIGAGVIFNDALFWSGGKDSFLALRAWQRTRLPGRQIMLLTTFGADEQKVAHQELHLADIIRQAKYLGLPLIGVPLHAGGDESYREAVESGLRMIPNLSSLVFGDLHLQHIRSWREQALEPLCCQLGVTLSFPLWGTDYAELIADLERSGVVCQVSAVTSSALSWLKPGEVFNRKLMEQLPAGIDRFGENGEFHTLAKVWDGMRD